MTGQKRFRDAFEHLAKDCYYLSNVGTAKIHFGPGTGNQSDDEMAFMCYFNLVRYADLAVRRTVNASLRRYWVTEEPEDSPLFNYIFAASYEGTGRFDRGASRATLADCARFSQAVSARPVRLELHQ